jgi:hypothetical protein
MDELIKEFALLEKNQYEIEKIQALNETLTQVSNDVRKQTDDHVKNITNIFNTKLKQNKNFNDVVNNYIDKYIPDDRKEEAREELFLILTGEMLGIFKGLSQTKCCIM